MNENDERWARVVWSYMVEPQDTAAYNLIETHGAAVALSMVLTENYVWADVDMDIAAGWRANYFRNPDAIHAHEKRYLLNTLSTDIDIVVPGDAEWPSRAMDKLGDRAPIILYTRGNKNLLRRNKLKAGMVGARAATGYGEHIAMEFAAHLVEHNYTIVSGAAFGIDAMSHRATLAAEGNTIAVLAGGVDRFYPSGNSDLLQKIVDSGLVVSELPPGSPPTKWRFLARNRIIAALSDVLVVVEAGYRSGSLNCAGEAKRMGTPVCAVPGPITSAASSGCHKLIREGAELVTTGDEVRWVIELN